MKDLQPNGDNDGDNRQNLPERSYPDESSNIREYANSMDKRTNAESAPAPFANKPEETSRGHDATTSTNLGGGGFEDIDEVDYDDDFGEDEAPGYAKNGLASSMANSVVKLAPVRNAERSLVLEFTGFSAEDGESLFADDDCCSLDVVWDGYDGRLGYPGSQISQSAKMLADEYGTASNIKSRVTRLSVLSAITSTQQRLKLYSKVPPNGLVIYCGTIVTAEGKEKQITIDIEPIKPINTSLYLCDNRFHVEALADLLESDSKFGFIVMDGNGTLFGTLVGNTREVIHKFAVDLPKKHGRGGQSALRFARLRVEKRHNYVRKVAELAVQFFITDDKCNCSGLVLAGSADFKTELSQSDMFDPRLQAKVIKVVDVSYGGENGFNQAIDLAQEVLSNVKFVQEKKLITKYFDEIQQDTGKYCFGVEDTLKALDLGAVETLIVWEGLDVARYVLKSPATGEEVVKHLNKDQEKVRDHFVDADNNVDYEILEKTPLIEWFAENYKDFGATLEFVTNKSQEGSQFVKGFGGIGGLLRYKVDFAGMTVDSDEEYFSD
ncbi:translation termination factor eRF1 [Entophlyctis luteolus]|nr:translation termination factor eRF1 [Entophlyctis luteolus]